MTPNLRHLQTKWLYSTDSRYYFIIMNCITETCLCWMTCYLLRYRCLVLIRSSLPSWLACTISTGIMELRHTPLRLKMVAKNSCTLPKPFKGMYITSMPTSMTVVNDDGQVMTRKPASVATSKISFTDLWLEPAVAYRSTQATFKPSELPHDGLWTHWFPFVRNSMHPTPLGFACLETDYKL